MALNLQGLYLLGADAQRRQITHFDRRIEYERAVPYPSLVPRSAAPHPPGGSPPVAGPQAEFSRVARYGARTESTVAPRNHSLATLGRSALCWADGGRASMSTQKQLAEPVTRSVIAVMRGKSSDTGRTPAPRLLALFEVGAVVTVAAI